jgi:hypothetical protein
MGRCCLSAFSTSSFFSLLYSFSECETFTVEVLNYSYDLGRLWEYGSGHLLFAGVHLYGFVTYRPISNILDSGAWIVCDKTKKVIAFDINQSL